MWCDLRLEHQRGGWSHQLKHSFQFIANCFHFVMTMWCSHWQPDCLHSSHPPHSTFISRMTSRPRTTSFVDSQKSANANFAGMKISSKDGSKVMTVIANPGQGPDRSTEVSYTDTKVGPSPHQSWLLSIHYFSSGHWQRQLWCRLPGQALRYRGDGGDQESFTR